MAGEPGRNRAGFRAGSCQRSSGVEAGRRPIPVTVFEKRQVSVCAPRMVLSGSDDVWKTFSYRWEYWSCSHVRLANWCNSCRTAITGDMQGHHVCRSSEIYALFSTVPRFLQDQSFFAVAQKKYVFIYDRNGVELHRLKSHIEPTRLEFLPYHWLLASVVCSLIVDLGPLRTLFNRETLAT